MVTGPSSSTCPRRPFDTMARSLRPVQEPIRIAASRSVGRVVWRPGACRFGTSRPGTGGRRSAVGGQRSAGGRGGRSGGRADWRVLSCCQVTSSSGQHAHRRDPKGATSFSRVSLRTHGPTSPQADDDDERTCVDCSQTHVAARPDDHCTTGRGSLSDLLGGCIPETSEWTCFSHPAHPAHPPHVCILLRYPPRGAAEGVGARARELRPVVGRKFPASALVGTWYINVL